jgi:hypothetical protein
MTKCKSFFVVVLFHLMFCSWLFALGRKETPADPRPVNTEYVFCITALDTSALPLVRQAMGDTVVRRLAGALRNLDFRFRQDEESAYYRDYAWTKSKAAAAKALEAERNRRDLLIYEGNASWKYRKNLRAREEAVAKLEAELVKTEERVPLVEMKPEVKLTGGNINGTWPAPPAPGGEYLFCTGQNADAFLTGSLSEYYGRVYLAIRVYTIHTGSYSFEDSVLFSSADFDRAMDEISGRLAAAVSETLPSGIFIRTDPEGAIAAIDGSYAGVEEVHTHSPGTVEISVKADNYVPVLFPLRLNAGELAELYINLTPLGYSALEVQVPGDPGSHVYVGGLYAGDTPLTLRLPKLDFSYVSVETPEGETGSIVFRDGHLVKGSAQFTHTGDPDAGLRAAFTARTPVLPEENRVDKARRGFYGTYGAFWFILPAALLTSGIAGNYILSHKNVVFDQRYTDDYKMRKSIYDRAVTAQRVQALSNAAWGAALGLTFFQIFRYLYVSGEDAAPIVKAPEKRTEP